MQFLVAISNSIFRKCREKTSLWDLILSSPFECHPISASQSSLHFNLCLHCTVSSVNEKRKTYMSMIEKKNERKKSFCITVKMLLYACTEWRLIKGWKLVKKFQIFLKYLKFKIQKFLTTNFKNLKIYKNIQPFINPFKK
jgi:hypothetical protein